ncbi:outer membrane channel protein TolC [Stakelama sediminis]|uniref:Outer membrane protein n=1 Tax=Stakelama sediminis TaxID=463200 RepID=A0A840YYM4_9SPHN|nr:TolC family protein [Stakelama sediminis]MBB5718616.1 outer membrane protein [Stakelama sediminis]
MKRLAILSLVLGGAAIAVPVHAQSLDQVIAAAIEHSPALEAARAQADAAQAGVDAARAERMPKLSVEGQVGTGRLDPKGYFGLQAADVTPRSAQATLELPLYAGGRIGAGLREAKGNRDAAKEQVRGSELALRVSVVHAYTNALAARRMIVRYQKLNAALDEVVRQAKLKYQSGAGTSTEVAQAQARQAEAVAGLAGAKGQLAVAETQLEALAGVPVTVSDILPGAPTLPPSAADAASRALTGNPQVLAAERMVKAASAGVDAAKAERLPTVGAYAQASTIRDQFFPGYAADSAVVGVRAKWELFSGGRNGAKQRGASAKLRMAEANMRQAQLQVRQQAVVDFQAVQTARALRDAAEARVTAADKALTGTQLEVKAGAKTQLDLLDAEREAIEAESNRVSAEGNLLVAAYRLRAIAGMD